MPIIALSSLGEYADSPSLFSFFLVKPVKKELLIRDNYTIEQNTIYGDGNSCSKIVQILGDLNGT